MADDWLVRAYMRPDPKPMLFGLGKCRIKGRVSRDGQTPKYWDNALVEIISWYTTGLYKDHIYKVRHLENGITCQFKEDELDLRYRKRDQ